jgi:surface antigen
LRQPAVQSAVVCPDGSDLYRARRSVGLLAIGPWGAVMIAILMGAGLGGCSVSKSNDAFAQMEAEKEITGSIGRTAPSADGPTDADLAFARNAASDVLTGGVKDSSQPWENPSTGARGSVTPLATSYTAADGRTCRDFLASYVNGTSETWMHGAACRSEHGRWDVHTLKPWRKS